MERFQKALFERFQKALFDECNTQYKAKEHKAENATFRTLSTVRALGRPWDEGNL